MRTLGNFETNLTYQLQVGNGKRFPYNGSRYGQIFDVWENNLKTKEENMGQF